MTTWWRFASAQTLDDLFAPEPLVPPERDQVLVGIVPRVSDFEIAEKQRWYRIPRTLVEEWTTPGYVAFYFGQAFGEKAGTITHYARVLYADLVRRVDLFPDQPRHPRANMEYYRIHIDELQRRPTPIRSRHRRRIVLLPTTWERFLTAVDLNDLSAGDAEEDAFYGRMTEEGLRPERSYYVRGTNAYYFTDFALLCQKRNVQVDVEQSQAGPSRFRVIRHDQRGQPAEGWEALRLSRFDITRRRGECVAQIKALVDASGGMVAH